MPFKAYTTEGKHKAMPNERYYSVTEIEMLSTIVTKERRRPTLMRQICCEMPSQCRTRHSSWWFRFGILGRIWLIWGGTDYLGRWWKSLPLAHSSTLHSPLSVSKKVKRHPCVVTTLEIHSKLFFWHIAVGPLTCRFPAVSTSNFSTTIISFQLIKREVGACLNSNFLSPFLNFLNIKMYGTYFFFFFLNSTQDKCYINNFRVKVGQQTQRAQPLGGK